MFIVKEYEAFEKELDLVETSCPMVVCSRRQILNEQTRKYKEYL